MRVLVTGGTGVLGREVAARLRPRAEVAVMSRRDSPDVVHGDLDTGTGLEQAVAGVDVIVHCASANDYRRPARDVDGTRRLVDAVRARGGNPHLVYISIVGIEKFRFAYYQGKLATEHLIEKSGLPWTILRTTQFHDLVLTFTMMAAKLPVAISAPGFRMQPVDAGEVATRLADLALGEPAGRTPDLGGPRVEEGRDLMDAYLAAAGRRKPVLSVPIPTWLSSTLAGFKAGHHLLGDGERGSVTFSEYLAARVDADGRIEPPYSLRGRL
jgi:uncharacterized protein YbjT (DUF2867 family)